MKKLVLTLLGICFIFTFLRAQTTVEEYFTQSFGVDFFTAMQYRKKIIELEPNSKYGLYSQAWFKAKEGKRQEAYEIAEILIKNHPDFIYSYLLKGNVLYYLQNYIGAIAEYNKVIDMDSTEIGGFHNRGLCKFYLDDYRGAIQDYNKALEINNNFPSSYYRRGLAKIKLGMLDEGCIDLSKAGELGYIQAYDEIKKNCKK